MASPPMARSPLKANVNIAHPIPDLQALQGAYVGNIERLEEHAERMSEAGSDLNEEIRKLHTELKRSESRRSSIHSYVNGEPLRQLSTRSRNVSTSSHANSIVDINGTARWGGYSPGGYVTSPVGSLRSGSISNPVLPDQRQRSGSKASRLGQIVHPEEVIEDDTLLAVYPGSPHSLKSAPPLHHSTSPPPANPRKVSSFTRKYEEIANELREDLRNSINFDRPSQRRDDDHNGGYQYMYANDHEYIDRPPTAASTDTTRQARTLWQDFDGAHCRDTVIEEEPTPPQSRNGLRRQSSYSGMLQRGYDMPQQGAPPPEDSMVYYPAPVPRMLNLPKRLSQLPSTSQQARRRTQLLDYMQTENRKSAPMLGDMVDNAAKPPMNNRKSLAALPPQLRASAYFDQPGPSQEYAVKGESAEDTLDSILDASARAPVSAFTDHPFAGNAGQDIYAPEKHKRKSSKLPDIPPALAETRRRSSFNLLDTKRNSSGDALNKLKKRNSSADMNLLIVKASESRMSLGDELDEHDEHARGPQGQDHETASHRSYDDHEGKNPDDVYDEEHMDDESEEEEPQMPMGKPTTLLAELQLRKAQQKTRNMNYATLVEQGNMPMHRTLLEMDTLAEKEKQKRLKKKVHLAWEAYPESDNDSEDDNVPLGVLAQQRLRGVDSDRPVGLIAQRELEDHEPLSRRAARLRGDEPNRSRVALGVSPSQAHLAVPTVTTPGPESEEEHEGETLGERMRRLREQKEREAALGDDVRKSTVSADFATEMFSKLGVSDETKDKDGLLPMPASTPSPGLEAEETLGQRRARLQAEAAAQPHVPVRPGLRQSISMADVLSANPMDMHNQARKISDLQLVSNLPQGSLLHQNHVDQERKKNERQLQNMRASSYGINSAPEPFVRTEQKNDDDTPLALKIQAYKNQMSGMGMQYPANPGFGGMQGNMSSANLSEQARQSYMPGMMNQPMMPNPQMMGMMNQMQSMQFQYPQTMGNQNMTGLQMPMGSPMGMPMGMSMQGMQMPMNGMGMMNMNMNMNGGMGMGMPMGMMMPPMDPRQRDQIDRWMQGIQH